MIPGSQVRLFPVLVRKRGQQLSVGSAEWSTPTTVVRHGQGPQPHGWAFQDPAAAWPDPTTPGRWLFIGEVPVAEYAVPAHAQGETIELWASHNAPLRQRKSRARAVKF